MREVEVKNSFTGPQFMQSEGLFRALLKLF